jgi:cytochrome P450
MSYGFSQTTATMATFCMILALYPDVMKRAQAELDGLTRGERLPTFDDQASLPYIDALFWETLRYNTVTPLGRWHLTYFSSSETVTRFAS